MLEKELKISQNVFNYLDYAGQELNCEAPVED